MPLAFPTEEWARMIGHVLDGYPSGAVPEGWRGAVLVPWPNRVRGGRWTWRTW